MNTIYLVLAGGLGNQMFQYAAARKVALQYGYQIKICSFFYSSGINADRRYSLGKLNLPQDICIASKEEESNIAARLAQYNNAWWKWLVQYMPDGAKELVMKHYIKKGIMRSLFGTYRFVEFAPHDAQDLIMHGGFQSLKNFELDDSQICQELSVAAPAVGNNEKYLLEIQNCNAVCTHIRRGDFLKPEFQHLNICTEVYYKAAVEYIRKHVRKPVFYVFSYSHEDVEWIKENYEFLSDAVFVDEENEDYQEFQLMSNCRHFIMANSTFSWWAQHIGHRADSIVCAPNEWDRQYPIESKEIFEKHWTLINCG